MWHQPSTWWQWIHPPYFFPIEMIVGDLESIPPTISIFISLNLYSFCMTPTPTHSAAKCSPSSGVSGSQTYGGWSQRGLPLTTWQNIDSHLRQRGTQRWRGGSVSSGSRKKREATRFREGGRDFRVAQEETDWSWRRRRCKENIKHREEEKKEAQEDTKESKSKEDIKA